MPAQSLWPHGTLAEHALQERSELVSELSLVELLCPTFLLVMFLHNVLVVLYDVGHTDVARDAHSCLIILNLLDERSAFYLRVARLHLA